MDKLEYGIVKEFKDGTTLWYEPVTDTLDAFVLRDSNEGIINIGKDNNIGQLIELNNIIDEQRKDIKRLIGRWFVALEDEGTDPWMYEECIKIANKYGYTEEDYEQYWNMIV